MWPFAKTRIDLDTEALASIRCEVDRSNAERHRATINLFSTMGDILGALRRNIERRFDTMEGRLAVLKQALVDIDAALTAEVTQIQEKLDAINAAANEAESAEIQALVADAQAIVGRIKGIVPDTVPVEEPGTGEGSSGPSDAGTSGE